MFTNNKHAEPMPPSKHHEPDGRPLKFKLRDSTLTSDVNQTLSNLLSQTNKLKAHVTTVSKNVTSNARTISQIAASPALNTPVIATAAYQSGVTYPTTAQCTYNGNVYAAIQSTLANLPTDTNYWALVGPQTLDNLANGTSYNRTTPNQVLGAGRAYSALDSNNRIASQLNINPLTAIAVFSAGNPLSQSGTSKTILIASNTIYWGTNTVSYNSGSVTPATYGLKYIYADDPTFAGGAVTYVATANQLDLFKADGRVNFGSITTAIGGGGTGGGGSCFSPNTKVKTQRGDVSFNDIRDGDMALTARGTWRNIVQVRCSEQTNRPMLEMGNGELVTLGHLFKTDGGWKTAEALDIFPSAGLYTGLVANLCIEADEDDDGSALDTEHSYTLANGHVVHNMPQGTN